MNVLRVILGIVFLLVALFAGGCSVLFTATFITEGDPYGFWPITLVVYLVAAGTGALSWWTLRRPRAGGAPTAQRE
jgi:hypothetical protein